MTTVDTVSTLKVGAAEKEKRQWRRPSVFVILAVGWLAIIILSTLLAPWIAPYGKLDTDLMNSSQGPSAAHLLGTDQIGRDVLSRIMFGAWPTLSSVALSVLVYVVIGLVFGLIAGYARGWTDRAIMALVSMALSLPGIIVLFVVLSVYRGNTYIAMTVFGFIASPVMILLVRASAIAVRDELFVDAARVAGLSPLYIIFRHVLPRSRGLIIVQGSVFAAHALIVESSLSYLGFGTQPPDPSWGNMIAQAAKEIAVSPWMLYPTGGVIALTALSLGIIGDSLRDVGAAGWSQSKLTKAVHRKKLGESAAAEAVAHSKGTAAADSPLLSVRDLSVGYRAGRSIIPIVREVSFDIGKGETVGLAGESGSGKTTVAFGVLGVVGEGVAITRGSVSFDGVDLLTLPENLLAKYRGKRIGYVAQEPMVALGPSHRVGDQLYDAVRLNGGLTGQAARDRVIELLTMTELNDPEGVSRKFLHELSGGMAQRVSIAFALAGNPELLVADEPTTALDVTVQAGILGLLRRLRDQTGMSLLIITHDWGVIADICDRVIVMYKGEIVEIGTSEVIFTEPKHPYTEALLTSNPHGAEPGRDLPVIEGTFVTPIMAREASLAAAAGVIDDTTMMEKTR